jgi:hypothetical protein
MSLGLCGVAGAGKDTVADFLVKNHGFVKVAFADPLKRICRDVFAFTDEQLWGSSEFRNQPDKRYPRAFATPFSQEGVGSSGLVEYLTPRYALQQLGTEWGRNCYPNTWAEYALRIYRRLQVGDCYYDQKSGLRSISSSAMAYPKTHVVIPDVRFRSEVDAILRDGGAIWKIERPGAGLQGAPSTHTSETEQLSIPTELFLRTVNNHNGSLADLETLVDAALDWTSVHFQDRK